jgi:hypothetical protein
VVEDLYFHVLFEIADAVSKLLLAHGRLLVAAGVHEHAVLVRRIEVLHGLFFQLGHVHLLAGPERPVDHISRLETFHLGPHERSALAGLHVLKLHDHVGLAFELDL